MKTDNTTLFFLRSSEQHILNKILPLSLDIKQNVEFFGFTSKDLGLYTMVDNQVVGAVWIRLKDFNDLPILNIAIKEEFRNKGITSLMLEQLFKEAGNIFEKLEIKVDKNLYPFLEKFSFEEINGSMVKTLEKNTHANVYDDYSSCKWMEP